MERTDRYAGLLITFAFFYSVFQGSAPDINLDNVRNRVVGILCGLLVNGLVFQYIWPERALIVTPIPASTAEIMPEKLSCSSTTLGFCFTFEKMIERKS